MLGGGGRLAEVVLEAVVDPRQDTQFPLGRAGGVDREQGVAQGDPSSGRSKTVSPMRWACQADSGSGGRGTGVTLLPGHAHGGGVPGWAGTAHLVGLR